MRNELMGCLILAAAGCATDTKTSSQDAATQQATNQSADFAEQALGASTLAAGMVPVAQGTPKSLQIDRIFSTPASTSGCVALPRSPMDTERSPGPAQMAPMPLTWRRMSASRKSPR